jgi:signal transduction histidine kinase
VKNFSRRAAAFASSTTLVLILFTVGLTGLLAYRAFDASRAQRQATENTLRDYAGFAAFQLKTAVINRINGQHVRNFDDVIRSINTRGAIPPLGARQVAALVDARRAQCHCIDSVSFYYQVTFADSGVEGSPSPLATAANLRMLRDTVMAQGAGRRDPPPLITTAGARQGVPIAFQFLVPIFANLDGRPFLFAHALTVDASNAPVVAYGYAAPAEAILGEAVRGALMASTRQPVLPRTLIRGAAVDSVISVRVMDVKGQVLFATSSDIDNRYAAIDSLDPSQGALRFEVSIKPSAAGRLVIGGLPRSRLPEVLATAFVAVCLLGLLMYQFRRQEELVRLRDDFVSGVSHELRTPLAQIRLLAELLRMGKVPTSADRDRSLRIIDQEARRLSFLVESILSFTRTKASELSPVSTDVAIEISEIVSGFEPLAQAQSVQLTTRLAPGLMADVDRSALRQVLLNLLDNAVRYGPPGQNVTVTTAAVGGDTWTLEVADEGPGVPADERERIFAPYYRMKRDAGGAVGGTGIGLAVVKQLVQQHDGEVRVANGGSAGARFIVTLPTKAREREGERTMGRDR